MNDVPTEIVEIDDDDLIVLQMDGDLDEWAMLAEEMELWRGPLFHENVPAAVRDYVLRKLDPDAWEAKQDALS